MYNFDINDIEDQKIKNYVDILNNYKLNCNQICNSINNTLSHLQILNQNYSQVSQKTNSLHNACEQILSDQVIKSNKLFFHSKSSHISNIIIDFRQN